MTLRAEILEQPAIYAALLAEQWPQVEQLAQAIRAYNPAFVLIAARGSSSHAAVYAQYLWGMYNRLPVALAAPSLFSSYARPPALRQALVIGISQSGQSPDIISVVAEGQAQGALTLAITNDLRSPLAQAAHFSLDLRAGVERAVAATKTYSAELFILALLSVALDNDPLERRGALAQVPGLLRQVLAQESEIAQIAERYQAMARCIVLARGYSLTTALEWALKLKELAAVAADPYSSAEFQHGPIVLAGPETVVLALAPEDVTSNDLHELLRQLVAERRVRLLALSNRRETLALGETALALPPALPDWLCPLVQIGATQLFSYHLTRLKGMDSFAPPGLHKVTRTL